MTRRYSSFHLRRGFSGFFFGFSTAPPEKKLANISLTSGNCKEKKIMKLFRLCEIFLSKLNNLNHVPDC